MRKKRKMKKATVKQEVLEDAVIKQEVMSDEDNPVAAEELAKDTTQIVFKSEDRREMNIEIELDIKPLLGTQECGLGVNVQSTSFSSHVKQEPSVEDIFCKTEEIGGDRKLFVTQDYLEIEETQLVRSKVITSSAKLMTSADDSSLLEETSPKVPEKPYKCNLCEKSFALKCTLKIHSQVHSDDRPYKCHLCDYKSKRPYTVREHVKQKHSGVKHMCNICQRAYSHQSYAKHMKIHTHNLSKMIKCEICSKKLNRFAIEAHMRKHSNYTFVCDHCNYKTTVKGHLSRHMQKHGFLTFMCDICHKSLSDSTTLRIHKLTHTGIKPYKCDVCKKSFTQPYYLKVHQALHSAQMPFKCDLCNYESKTKGNLRRHIMRHKRDRPHKCDLCNCAFKVLKSLEKHKLCHTDDADKPFRCTICCRSFTCKVNLAVHTRSLSHIRALKNEIHIK